MIPDYIKVKASDNKILPLGLKFSFITQKDKLIIEANSPEENLRYVGQILMNPNMNQELVKQSFNDGQYKILQKTQHILKIKIGWNILQMTSKSKSQIKELKDIIQKSLQKQSQMQKVIENQYKKMHQYQIEILELRKLTQQHQIQIKEIKKAIKELKKKQIETVNTVTVEKPVRNIEVIQKQEQTFNFQNFITNRRSDQQKSSPIIPENNQTLLKIQTVLKYSAIRCEDIIELNLSDIPIKKFTLEMKMVLQKCKNLEILILTGCKLQSLNNLPNIDLTAIDLTCNKLGDDELIKLVNYENLGQLIMNENNIQKVQSVSVLKKLQHLSEIDFSDNPICRIQNYREKIFNVLPRLVILDRFDRNGVQQDDEENNQFVDSDRD